MEPPAQKRVARILLLVWAVLGLIWLGQLDYTAKISTNVIDLVPHDERSPELSLLRALADERQARIVLIAFSDDAAPGVAPTAAAQQVVQTLRASPLFAEVALLSDSTAQEALGAYLFARRHDLLLPTWLAQQEQAFAASGQPPEQRAAWLAEQTVAALDQLLLRPEAAAFSELVLRDPLLLVPKLLLNSQAFAPPPSTGRALIWARLAVSPLSPEGQAPVFAVLDAALAQARVQHPGLTCQWTGVNRFAAASRARIEGELSWLNTVSLLAVLGVAAAFVRQTWKAVHLVPVILFSLLSGWVVVTACFTRVHILVFVVGALLSGVAIDYGFYLYLQPAQRLGERYREKLKRLLKPLLTSCLTTVIGFSFLLYSELPLIRQLGVFVSAGLVGALATAILYFAQLDNPYLVARDFTLRRGGARRAGWVRWLGVGALLVALTGPWRLHWADNIRQLDVPNPELTAQDRAVRALFGERPGQSAYITRGDSLEDARDQLGRFAAWHAQAFPGSTAASIGLVLPTAADAAALPARLGELGDFPARLEQALARHDYELEAFAPFFTAWRELAVRTDQPAYAELAAELQARLTGPLGMLFFTRAGTTWLLTLADHAPGAEPPPALGTVGVNQLESLNALFARYRSSALQLSALGLGLIGLSVFVLYGWRRGVRIFLIPSGSCLFAFGVLGYVGHSLNMFHLLGAFLGVCLSHNYAIFSAENSGRGEPPPVSIRLSALTTAASFGVLGFSHIPVVAALGSTVALIVLTALALVELEPLGRAVEPVPVPEPTLNV